MRAFELDLKLKTLVTSERKITLEILKVIQILDISRTYLELGYSSLFEYLTKAIGYSEGSAQRRISSARLLKQVPELEANIKSGEINLTQVSQAQSALVSQEKAQGHKFSALQKAKVLSSLKSKNSFETKSILQSALPSYDPTPKTQINPRQDKVAVTLNFSKGEWSEIQNLLSVNSHKVPDQKLESLLLRLAREQKKKQLSKNTAIPRPVQISPPLRRLELSNIDKNEDNSFVQMNSEEFLSAKKIPASQSIKTQTLRNKKLNRRKHIPVAVKRTVFAKANHQCEYVSNITGHRCNSKAFLQLEHRTPVALGGSDRADNLRVFCQQHNFLAAKIAGVSTIV